MYVDRLQLRLAANWQTKSLGACREQSQEATCSCHREHIIAKMLSKKSYTFYLTRICIMTALILTSNTGRHRKMNLHASSTIFCVLVQVARVKIAKPHLL